MTPLGHTTTPFSRHCTFSRNALLIFLWNIVSPQYCLYMRARNHRANVTWNQTMITNERASWLTSWNSLLANRTQSPAKRVKILYKLFSVSKPSPRPTVHAQHISPYKYEYEHPPVVCCSGNHCSVMVTGQWHAPGCIVAQEPHVDYVDVCNNAPDPSSERKGLPPGDYTHRQRRYVLYWYWATCIFRYDHRRPLPRCVVADIRALWPNSKGDPYTKEENEGDEDTFQEYDEADEDTNEEH